MLLLDGKMEDSRPVWPSWVDMTVVYIIAGYKRGNPRKKTYMYSIEERPRKTEFYNNRNAEAEIHW